MQYESPPRFEEAGARTAEKVKGDTLAVKPQLHAAWIPGASRKQIELSLDEGRLARIDKLAADYGGLIGRRVSHALVLTRALDLLADHLDGLEGEVALTLERLTLLGHTRLPIAHTPTPEEDDT